MAHRETLRQRFAPREKFPLKMKPGSPLKSEDFVLLHGLNTNRVLILYGEGLFMGLGSIYPIRFCFRYSYNPITKESSWPECLNLNLKKESWETQ